MGYDFQGQRDEVVEGGIKYQRIQFWVCYGGLGGREVFDGLVVDYYVRRREVQAMQRVFDYYVYGVGVVRWERRVRVVFEVRVVLVQYGVVGFQWRGQVVYFVEVGVVFIVDDEAQVAVVVVRVLAAIYEYGVDFVVVTGYQFGTSVTVAFYEAFLVLLQQRQQRARYQEYGVGVYELAV